MVPYTKVTFEFFWGIGQKLTTRNSESSLSSNSMCHSKIPTNRFCPVHKKITQILSEFSELSLWLDTQLFDIWSIPPVLEVLPLAQKYQNEQKDFDSKMADRRLHVYSAQITSLQLY